MRSLSVTTVMSVAVSAAACDYAPLDKEYDSYAEQIINGDLPASPGALELSGAVQVGGGSGTLITNQHVLTARHCLGSVNVGGQWSPPAVGQTVTLERPGGNDTRVVTRAFVDSNRPWNHYSTDYAVVEVDSPFEVGTSTTDHYKPIHSGIGLQGQAVTCVGFGNTTEATDVTFAGDSDLRWADLHLDVFNSTEYRVNRDNDQVGAAGDSGSSCYLGGLMGAVTTVQSTCHCSSFNGDLNGNGIDDFSECKHYDGCFGPSSSYFQSFVHDHVLADVRLSTRFVPESAGETLSVYVSTLHRELSVMVSPESSVLNTDVAPRSGWAEVEVLDEPDGMMCARDFSVAPNDGELQVVTTCMDDGLVSVLTS